MAVAEQSWLEHTVERLRAEGYRSGGARTAVIEVLAEQDCCLGAQEIFDLLRERGGRKVGIASVYRVLELLASLGLVQRVELGAVAARYEPVHPDGDHHHHVVCDDCGRIAAFADERLEHALDDLSERLGYEIAGHDVVLHGACGDCGGDPRR